MHVAAPYSMPCWYPLVHRALKQADRGERCRARESKTSTCVCIMVCAFRTSPRHPHAPRHLHVHGTRYCYSDDRVAGVPNYHQMPNLGSCKQPRREPQVRCSLAFIHRCAGHLVELSCLPTRTRDLCYATFGYPDCSELVSMSTTESRPCTSTR